MAALENNQIQTESGSELRLRLANGHDSGRLLEWRNDVTTRSMSIQSDEVSLLDHQAWFARALQRDDLVICIGEQDLQPIGMVRFDVNGADAVVSINLAPFARGRRLSATLIVRAEAFLQEGVSALFATIKVENGSSQRAFQRAGYQFAGPHPELEGHIRYIKTRPNQV
jgi:UDP-2,4-diacetamido-2,4,6-trideoxy-beta-L-altropyranose hydrolase